MFRYDLFLAGFFDLHTGDGCSEPADLRDYSLPMAFVHTIWTIKERYSHLKLLNNVEIGTLIVDSCSEAGNAIQIASKLQTDCIEMRNDQHNISISRNNCYGMLLTSPQQNPAASILKTLPALTLTDSDFENNLFK